MAAFGGNDSCPNCNARMAADQRYCLNCGHRRGEPRLPFMDAVVFMESMNGPAGGGGATPSPPPSKSDDGNRWNANAALIAGVATLVLAIGVGFLIGRSGHDSGTQAAQAPIKVIEVGGGGGTEEAAAAPEAEATTGKKSSGKSEGKSGGKSAGKAPAKKKASEVKEGSKEEKERAEEKTKEVLHSTVPTVETGTQVGDSCKPGVAGCSANGKFEGNFFGE
jgi:hypothetical protein